MQAKALSDPKERINKTLGNEGVLTSVLDKGGL
jgi:hypothetical protein